MGTSLSHGFKYWLIVSACQQGEFHPWQSISDGQLTIGYNSSQKSSFLIAFGMKRLQV